MTLTLLLALLAAGALILPNIGSDDDDDDKPLIRGTFENDTINGTDANEEIRGFKGDDILNGLGGNDNIFGGEDNDTISGGPGLDFVRGGPGNDTISGDGGDDRLISDRGDDRVDGGFGSDVIRGGEGNDVIFGGLDARVQPDGSLVLNEARADQITGEEGDDIIYVWGDGSRANGAEDDDTLIAVTGDVTLVNQAGANTNIVLANAEDDQTTDAVVEDFDLEDDTLVLTIDYASNTTSDAYSGPAPDLVVSFQDVPGTPTQGFGTLVTVAFAPPAMAGDTNFDDVFTESESASVFLLGLTADQVEANLNFEAILTEDASYADPESTIRDQINPVLGPNAVPVS
ncbi:MAG: calcium-binding protein [Pseudomonadota bacterium]